MGKRALLAAWLARREAVGDPVPHHFIRRAWANRDDPVTRHGDQGSTGARQPARGGGAVEAERGAYFLDRETVDDLLAQQGADLSVRHSIVSYSAAANSVPPSAS